MTRRRAAPRTWTRQNAFLPRLVASHFFSLGGTHLSSEDKRSTDSRYFSSHSPPPPRLLHPLCTCHLINYTPPSFCCNNHWRLISSRLKRDPTSARLDSARVRWRDGGGGEGGGGEACSSSSDIQPKEREGKKEARGGGTGGNKNP